MKLPFEVQRSLDVFSLDELSAQQLYTISPLIAEWFMANNYSYLNEYLKSLPITNKRVLLATLSDEEHIITSEEVLATVSSFISSTDRYLAQTATAFLIISGSTRGRQLVDEVISTQEVPHLLLVESIITLLT